jgi:superfamily I DNA and/or RNA helicase
VIVSCLWKLIFRCSQSIFEKRSIPSLVDVMHLIQKHEKEKLAVVAAVHLDKLKVAMDQLRQSLQQLQGPADDDEDVPANRTDIESKSGLEWVVETEYKAGRLKELDELIAEQVSELQAHKCDYVD